MRYPLIVAALLLAVMLPVPASAQSGAVLISEVYPDPATDEREFIELWNSGLAAVDLTGWNLTDSASNAFTFGERSLPAGARIVVWSGGEADARGPAWGSASVWNNGGDQAILTDAAGATVDVFAYGDQPWPDGRSEPVPAAPAKGDSLSLHDGAWIHAQPTPGSATQDQGGAVSATVSDIPPAPTITAPAEVEPGATAQVTVAIHDGNGDEDIASWRLLGDGALLHNGTAPGEHDLVVTAPSDRDQWTLRIEATDAGGQTGSDEVIVTISARGLVVIVPEGGIPFPAFPPGADEVLSQATFTLRNDGDQTATPRIDVSDLAGPATIPVVGHLSLRYDNGTWHDYDGPLTTLPSIAAGQSVEVQMRLSALPTPLPAGAYGTSFSVIA